jgi:hypothetical protein
MCCAVDDRKEPYITWGFKWREIDNQMKEIQMAAGSYIPVESFVNNIS